ncbi:MAG: S1C family serine protease [Thioalkalivibrio sp.]|nr:S1C family serine protease [Thioalkalivibrio sp.]
MSHTRLGTLLTAATLAWAACTPANGASEPGGTSATETESFVTRVDAAQSQERSVAVSDTIDRSRSTAIVRAAGRVAPSVVSINVIRTQRVQPRTAWESFFIPPGAQRRSAGFGSGVIVRADGIVLTNDHVIRDATQIRVTLPDGRDLDAELVGTVEGLLIGEWAVAIGNPLGTYAADSEPTVTAGVVSAVGRNSRTRGVRVSRVAPGSPADEVALEVGDRLLVANGRALTGPLDFEGTVMDLRSGDRLELLVEGQSRSVSLEAVPFPSVVAQRVRVLSDIELITVTPQIQVERALTSTDGALIAGISSELESQLGLRSGDVIVQVNRTRIRSAEDAATAFESLRGTGRIVMYFERNGDYTMRNFNWSR